MSDRVLYVCEACGHEGRHWFRKNRYLCCAACEVQLEFIGTGEDWAPEPTEFWKRPDGTYTLPGQRGAKMPAEYERIEVQETHEKRRIVREIEREEREKWERVQIGKDRLSEINTAACRSALRDRMQSMSPAQRDFARFAMDQNNQKPRPQWRGAFYLQALEFDASNREPYRGPDGLGRGRK